MIAVGDVLTIPTDAAIDVAWGKVSGDVVVAECWDVDGTQTASLANSNGRQLVSSWPLTCPVHLKWDSEQKGFHERNVSAIQSQQAAERTRTNSDSSGALATGLQEVGADVSQPGVRFSDRAHADGRSGGGEGGISQEAQGGLFGVPPERPTSSSTTAKVNSGTDGLILAIDLMNVLARSFHATSKSGGNPTGSFLGTITKCLDVVKPAAIVFAAEGGKGHRHKLHPDYKSSREETPDELRAAIAATHEAIEAIGWTILRVDGYEADDVLATVSKRVGLRAVIATSDKDLLQLAGRSRVFDPFKRVDITTKDVEEKYGIGAGQLADWLALCGDKSDDVPGVPGVGPKKATALLQEFESLETVLAQSAFRQNGAGAMWASIYQNKEKALLSRRLVDLVDSLDLPMGCLRRCYRTRAGWTDRLREMGFGANAVRLGTVLENLESKDGTNGGDDLSRQPETTGRAGDTSVKHDSDADDYRSGATGHDQRSRSLPEAADTAAARSDNREPYDSTQRVLQRGSVGHPDDQRTYPAWITACVQSGIELTDGPNHVGNWSGQYRGQKFILHSWNEKLTAVATGNSYTLDALKQKAGVT